MKKHQQDKSLLEILQSMPEVQRENILKEFNTKINEMQDSIKEQAAITSVKQVYINLGIDVDKIQNDYILLSGLQMLGVALISMVAAVIIMLLSAICAARLGKTLRDKVFKKVLQFSHNSISNYT